MADPNPPAAPGPEADEPTTAPPRAVRAGRYATEGELAAAADAARRRARLTQTTLAARLGVGQSAVSAALDPTSAKGAALRRRILADLVGLNIAGPYWLPLRPGETAPGYDPARDDEADETADDEATG